MSIAGIAGTALYSVLNGIQGQQSNQNQNNFQQFQTEFQQLGQDLQSGNLTQAEQDYTTLSQNFPNLTTGQTNNASSNNPIAQAFSQLSQDLQNGNLSAAQQDYATIQQDFQQAGQSQFRPHHHHHGSGGVNSEEQTQINQDFSSLASALQSGNLSGAQSAFASLQQDLEQLSPYGSTSTTGGASSTSSSSGGNNLSITI